MSKKQLTEIQRETYNLEMANRRLKMEIGLLRDDIQRYREHITVAVAKNITLEDEVETKNRLIDHLTAERDQLKAMVKTEAHDAYWEASDNNRADRWSPTFDDDIKAEFEKYWSTKWLK